MAVAIMADKGRKPLRLDRFLVEMGKGSRKEIREMAQKGRIRVNGEVEKKSDRKIDPSADQVEIDREPVEYAATEYFMLNKPQGVVSATEDSRYQTVIDLIDGAVRRDLFPVGRLDLDTEGLLLITNDGALAHRLLSPKKHVDKVYLAHVKGRLPENAVKRMEDGIDMEDGWKTLPAVLKIIESVSTPSEEGIPVTKVTLTIQEGKFHQVKRMFELLGCQVIYLKRLSMGPLKLDDKLLPGEYRRLTEEEIECLKNT